jgi:hypothetical protein
MLEYKRNQVEEAISRLVEPKSPRGEHRAKSVPPESNGLVTDVDPALGQQILDVA